MKKKPNFQHQRKEQNKTQLQTGKRTGAVISSVRCESWPDFSVFTAISASSRWPFLPSPSHRPFLFTPACSRLVASFTVAVVAFFFSRSRWSCSSSTVRGGRVLLQPFAVSPGRGLLCGYFNSFLHSDPHINAGETVSSEKENWLVCLETENIRLQEFNRSAVDLDETTTSLAVSHCHRVLLPTEALNLFHFALSAVADSVIAARVLASEDNNNRRR